jgi:hypothetical protein
MSWYRYSTARTARCGPRRASSRSHERGEISGAGCSNTRLPPSAGSSQDPDLLSLADKHLPSCEPSTGGVGVEGPGYSPRPERWQFPAGGWTKLPQFPLRGGLDACLRMKATIYVVNSCSLSRRREIWRIARACGRPLLCASCPEGALQRPELPAKQRGVAAAAKPPDRPQPQQRLAPRTSQPRRLG